ncbi:hypothetical protein HII28_19490 [Planctomonas sp. JC2975]|uniref:hypothetical protein n=1 Tax=Planctomonas sp. JC2975 TaxID=2729626 RepID=UPI00147513CA|nr:hypothetical protein [Planctomonas sp. JC2975]NNC14047.1 hypothetical protein [Planctomonas sp. JC2975]
MSARVTPIRPGVDDDLAAGFEDAAWLSTEVSIDAETGERADPFQTVSARSGNVQETPDLT